MVLVISHAELVEELRDRGLLLVANNTLPSIATRIAGDTIRGSWWAHPKSHAKVVERWDRWARRVGAAPLKDFAAARRTLEAAADALASPRDARSTLPWARRST